MKQYAADRHAQYILQIAIPIASILLIIMIWYFLAILLSPSPKCFLIPLISKNIISPFRHIE